MDERRLAFADRPSRPTGLASGAGADLRSISRAAATIRSVLRPTSRFVPSVIVTGRSLDRP